MSDHVTKRLKSDEESGRGAQSKYTPPTKICNLSVDRFKEAVHTAAYVDKTLFIKAFLEAEDKAILITAPRKFNKTTNMDMVKEFLSGNRKLFEDNKLKIYEEERDFFDKNCIENPVIRLRMIVHGYTFEAFSFVIQDAYHDHWYLQHSVGENWVWSNAKLDEVMTVQKFLEYRYNSKTFSREEIIEGLLLLSQCLYVYHDKPVYVLIDEFDYPIMKALMKRNVDEVLTETINLIGDIMSTLFKDNKYVKRGLLVACVRVAELLFGDANIKCCDFLTEPSFLPYFGFTADEVENLFNRNEFVSLKDDEIQKWYNGYKALDSDTRIYCNTSILEYLCRSKENEKNMFGMYWAESRSVSCIKKLIVTPRIRKLTDDLIKGEEVVIKTVPRFSEEHIVTLKSWTYDQHDDPPEDEIHLFLQFLLHNGYFNVVKYNRATSEATIKVPNTEIEILLNNYSRSANLFYKTRESVLEGQWIVEYEKALESVLTVTDRNAFIRLTKAVSDLFKGPKMPYNDTELRAPLFTHAWNLRRYRSNLRGERPHIYIFIVYNSTGLIIVAKRNSESAEEAYTEIQTRSYHTAFDEHEDIEKKIYVGLDMDEGRKVNLCYSVNDSDKETVTSDM